MIVDTLTSFCDATALNTGGAGTYLIGSQIDLDSANINLGAGSNTPWLVIRVETATTVTTTTGTLVFKLASDASAAVATDGSASVHITTTLVTGAQAAGTTIFIGQLPSGVYERYLGLLQVTGTEATTAGKIDAFLTFSPNLWRAYPDAI